MPDRPPEASDTEYVTCPVCKGHGAPQGDGSGWDSGGTYHAPACDFCAGDCAVPLRVFEDWCRRDERERTRAALSVPSEPDE